MNCIKKVQAFHSCSILSKIQGSNLKKKKHSSQLWINRQINDPYVAKAKKENYRCRSAFKLLEIHEQHNIIAPGHIVVDCGAAPGSWTQVAVKLTNSTGFLKNKPKGRVIAIDRSPFLKIDGAEILINMDFTTPESHDQLRKTLGTEMIDVLLSDMAPNASGTKHLDHENITRLVYSALKFSMGLMRTGGTFLAKLWDGEMTAQLQNDLSKFYRNVKIKRPQATRSDSSELFLLATDFKGLKQSS